MPMRPGASAAEERVLTKANRAGPFRPDQERRTRPGGYVAGQRLLASINRPTAIFATSDMHPG